MSNEKDKFKLKLHSKNGGKETALHLMARRPSAMSCKNQLFKKLAYSVSGGFFCPEIKMQTPAHQLVEKLCGLPFDRLLDLVRPVTKALVDAADSGNVEFLIILIRYYPDLIWITDDRNQSLFHIAAVNRHVEVFNIIYELRGIKYLVASFDHKEVTKDGNENDKAVHPDKGKDKSVNAENEEKVSYINLLHLVAHLPPQDRLEIIPGAALQMQRELIWFKKIEEIVPRSYVEAKNSDGHTPQYVFTKEHKELCKEGEKWMKDTATACMLVATLIATVVFGAVFAVPGSYDDNTGYDGATKHNGIAGYPRFRKRFWFDMFIMSDSVSLLSSVTAVLLFLSILTSRFTEEDFREALPTKLILGLMALFVSVVSMVLAFTSTLILFRDQDDHEWSLIIIICLASLAPITFTILNTLLWCRILRSTFFSTCLFRGRNSGLFSFNKKKKKGLFSYFSKVTESKKL